MMKRWLASMGVVAMVAMMIASCEGEATAPVEEADFDVVPQVSACGGFVGGGTGAKIPEPDPTTYCDAERLLWNYDAATKTLGVTNSRIMLNCCGDHSISVSKDGDTVVFTEVDAPQNGSTRCKCMCVYDYGSDISPIESGVLSFRLVRNVTDASPAVSTVWEGTIDLSAGAGEVVVSTVDAGGFCTPPAP